MTLPWIAACVALFLWWFSTGAILAVVKRADGGGPRSHLWAVLLATPMLVLGAAMFVDTVGLASIGGVYAGFCAALMIWGWIEMSFLCGVITGPNQHRTPSDVPEWERFLRAWGAVAYHEVLLVTVLVALLSVAHGAVNPFGAWTFAVLFAARISAKLNLFAGVPKIHTDFLPEPLAHIPSHFRMRRMTWLFPFSVTALSVGLAVFLALTAHATTPEQAVGFALLSAMTGLALLEHWMMVLPLPDEKLWRWVLPGEARPDRPETTP